jgi:hypothetical protein
LIVEESTDNTLKFNFENINLTYKDRDEAGSMGYVSFQIYPKAGIKTGTRIDNHADIYFDFNVPVRTNAVYNTMVEELPLNEEITQYVDACGPYKWINGVTYHSDNSSARHTLKTAYGCDSLVKLDLTMHPLLSTKVNRGVNSLELDASADHVQWVQCDSNYKGLESDTNLIFSPKHNGSFAAIVSNEFCTDTTDCFTFTNVSVDPLGIHFGLNIYPNPFKEKVLITSLNPVLVSLTDMQGKVLFQTKISGGSELDLKQFADGIYLLQIQHESGASSTHKLLKCESIR